MAAWNPKANHIFLQALDLRSPQERPAYLDEACGTNAELRAQVESLLSASERAGHFLEEPAVAPRSKNTYFTFASSSLLRRKLCGYCPFITVVLLPQLIPQALNSTDEQKVIQSSIQTSTWRDPAGAVCFGGGRAVPTNT